MNRKHISAKKIILIVLVTLTLSLLGYLRLFGGKVLQELPSPDGRVFAEVRFYDFTTAMDSPEIAVQMKGKFNPLRQNVFFAITYGGSVSISWRDAQTLVIRCTKCGELQAYRREEKWKNIAIQYSFD